MSVPAPPHPPAATPPDTDPALALQGLARRLARGGEAAAALAEASTLVRQRPADAEGWKLLGIAAQQARRPRLALGAKQRAAALQPQQPELHNNLGNALAALGRLVPAVQAFERAITLDPSFAEAHNNLGLVLHRLDRLDAAAHHFERALALRPGFAEAHSNLLFMLSHDARLSATALFEAHRRFDDRHGQPHRARWPKHPNSREPERRLRVGFVSGDLRRHAVARFIAPLWRAWDHGACALLAYSTGGEPDETSAALRACTDGWTDARPLNDDALARTIQDDRVDILIDLSGHTRHNRLPVFARKPAPIQVTAIGYPNTSGLSAMDYRITDRHRMPPQLAALNVEHLALVPSTSTFDHGPAPEPNALPALRRGHVTFGSFQRSAKLTTDTLDLWAAVLHRVPGAQLLIGAIEDRPSLERLATALQQRGVAPQRLQFRGPLPMQDYLALHHQIDLLLDSHPYPGGTTLHHGLWMGVPTVTRTGEALVSWQGAGILRRAGLGEFVAHDDAGYVALAAHWAAQPEALARLRAGLREQLRQAPLMQPAAVAAGFQAALRTMWRRWCAGLPPASFEVSG